MELHQAFIDHLTKTAKHHAAVATEHHGFAELHRTRASNLEADGDPVGAGHHREKAARHTRKAKLHEAHSKHCEKSAREIGDAFGDSSGKTIGEPDLQKLVSD